MSLCDGSTVKIQCTNLEKDLGIMIDSGLLTFVEHMHMVSKKTNGITSVIRRTFTRGVAARGGGSRGLDPPAVAKATRGFRAIPMKFFWGGGVGRS